MKSFAGLNSGKISQLRVEDTNLVSLGELVTSALQQGSQILFGRKLILLRIHNDNKQARVVDQD